MQAHHYLGALPKIGETLWYVACWGQERVALLSFSAAALKCGVRDQWIGWSYRHQYDRLKLLANNTRFCILPAWHRPNLASRTLALCERGLSQDWQAAFAHPLLLLESFVDPQRYRGTLYQASNWEYVGDTRGSPKKVIVRPLHAKAHSLLCQAQHGPPTFKECPNSGSRPSKCATYPSSSSTSPIRGAVRGTRLQRDVGFCG